MVREERGIGKLKWTEMDGLKSRKGALCIVVRRMGFQNFALALRSSRSNPYSPVLTHRRQILPASKVRHVLRPGRRSKKAIAFPNRAAARTRGGRVSVRRLSRGGRAALDGPPSSAVPPVYFRQLRYNLPSHGRAVALIESRRTRLNRVY